ncbi:hypothetical protein ABMA27_006686 [Loxostege sticticalis]|uniref:Uncharacterized protein n=1 Tax=Loxostege sticticalis TaxID=481309 RepID=A0ABR3IK11_LOXSC
MASKGGILFTCHVFVWAAAALALWAGGARAAARYDTATPHTPPYSNGTVETGRGMEDYYDEHHHHETTPKPMKQSRYTDPWAGYYDWIINEGSFKFWSAFQLFTAAVLLYACFSAIYYAKFNPILPDYSLEYDDYFLERTVGRKARSLDSSELPSGLSWINSSTFQFILDAIVKHYEEE